MDDSAPARTVTALERPALLFCPYLPLSRPVVFSGWWLGPLDEFDGSWHGERFEDLSRRLLAGFRDADGRPLKRLSLLARMQSGTDGVWPPQQELEALQAAIHFALLYDNSGWTPDPALDTGGGWFHVTTDNGDLFAWAIDLDKGQVALRRGAMVTVTSGGWQIERSDFQVPAPLELFLPLAPTSLDPDVLTAVYEITMDEAGVPERNHNLRTAMRWLAKSHRNSPSITSDDRVVMLKTGFEALTGESRAGEFATKLQSIFDGLKRDYPPGPPPGRFFEDGDLLWSASQGRRLKYRWRRSRKEFKRSVTQLEHWALSFSDVRNEIIHDGVVPDLRYRKRGSTFEGHYVWVGERVLREAISVELRHACHPYLWRSSTFRKILREWGSSDPQ